MPREGPSSERLDRLLGLLQSRAHWTASALAGELGVSLRTVRRDLARLSARGVPIESERGRGGGLRVSESVGVGRLQLDHRELLDLLLALAVAERLESPLLLASVRALRQKLSVAFPPAQRRRVSRLRARILLGKPASAAVVGSLSPTPPAVLRPLQDAFFTERTLELSYRASSASPTRRVVEPHYLLLNWPVWYVLVFDHLRGAGRCLRLDRIESASPPGEPFRPRPAPTLMDDVAQFFTAL